MRALDRLNWDRAGEWLGDHGIQVLLVVVAVWIANRMIRHLVPPSLRRAVLRDANERTEADLRKRADTLGSVLVRTAQIALLAVASLLILSEVGYNIAPLLTGLGVGGIALGLGAQSLVRDTINGIFILTENQFGRGDLVTVAGVQGWVEDINLRRTVLRDLDGTLYSIPNGEIKVTGNLTRGYSGLSLLVPLLNTGDVDRAIEVIDAAGNAVANDPRYAALVLEPPRAVRVEGLTEKTVMLRVLGKATAGAQFEVSGATRRAIKRGFDEAGLRFGDPPPAAPAPPVSPPRG